MSSCSRSVPTARATRSSGIHKVTAIELVGMGFHMEPRPWLHGYPWEPPAISAVVCSPQAARLREVRFSFWDFSERDIQALCESPHLAGLAVLGVQRVYLTDSRLLERFGARLQDTCCGGGTWQ